MLFLSARRENRIAFPSGFLVAFEQIVALGYAEKPITIRTHKIHVAYRKRLIEGEKLIFIPRHSLPSPFVDICQREKRREKKTVKQNFQGISNSNECWFRLFIIPQANSSEKIK